MGCAPSKAAVDSTVSSEPTANAPDLEPQHLASRKSPSNAANVTTPTAKKSLLNDEAPSPPQKEELAAPSPDASTSMTPSSITPVPTSTAVSPPTKQQGSNGSAPSATNRSLVPFKRVGRKNSGFGLMLSGGNANGSKHKTPPPPATRKRADSWANNTPGSTSNQTVQTPTTVQWKMIWDTQADAMIDPVDVPAVLDTLASKLINRLSAAQLTLLQRKVRKVIKTYAAQKGNQSQVMAKRNFKFGNSTAAAEQEARTLLDKQHLLADSVLQQILPPSAVLRQIILLLKHFHPIMLSRVQSAAVSSAQAASLDMDVNKQTQVAMPKPSRVPDLEPIEASPTGVSLTALASVVALALEGTRHQRLQLLFYACMDYSALETFLLKHSAGGAPVWLWEVDQGVVVSLASLTHYHYYGHAFLPITLNDDGDLLREPFCASASRQPVTVLRSKVIQLVLWARRSSPATTNGHTPSPPETRRGSKRNATEEESNNGQAPLSAAEETDLMRRLQQVSDTGIDVSDTLDEHRYKHIHDAAGEKEVWTLEDFASWAEEAMDDWLLERLMYKLFGQGILPTPALERELVQQKWEDWQVQLQRLADQQKGDDDEIGVSSSFDVITQSVKALMEVCGTGEESQSPRKSSSSTNSSTPSTVWGGLGGIDGGGGLGRGVLYCIDKKWWDSWTAYVGWSWLGERPGKRFQLERPPALSTEALLDRDAAIRGTLGSYELMKASLKRDKDYVLVPPGVWDTLYEMYGGGPPLPRMVKASGGKQPFTGGSRGSSTDSFENLNKSATKGNDSAADALDNVVEELRSNPGCRVFRIPETLSVVVHPWVIHCHLCDPLQPYRRGDAGPLSIRVMASPDQPLWRLYVELITRFPLQTFKAFDGDGRGKARIWKKSEGVGGKDPVSRYGPWNLLCKSRYAVLPLLASGVDLDEEYDELVENWKAYTDNATVESIGLGDLDHIMLEFAVQSKSGDLMWPREAAAKAGRVRRLAEEDAVFRQVMQGVDAEGSLLLKPPNLVGMEIDAMDSTGRWYPVKILEVEIVDVDGDDEEDEDDNLDRNRVSNPISRKHVKVDFANHGGHEEWIDVDTDRLAKMGRFTSEAEQQGASLRQNGANSTANDAKAKPSLAAKKSSSLDSSGESTKLNILPGYGATGLTNLGNTCYMNSALQCISYMPLLRSYLLSTQYKATGDLNKDNPLGTGGRLLEESAELLRTMWSARHGEKSPTRFRSQLGKINSQFGGADQQDAQEFLNYMLDVLHEDSNKVRKKPYVEALEDDFVKKTSLPRVGEEAWKRFLRRNQSIMADVAMGQVLNTVTCPKCNFSSRNFDPFNLLSIPIPTVAHVVFQCTVIRRASALNCPWVLNKSKRGDKQSNRFPTKATATTPPSEANIAEEYVISMSRLADSSDLRHELEKICGIPASRLRVCRVEQIENELEEKSVLDKHVKVIPMTGKEGPCSQLARKRTPNETASGPTRIVAFELSLRNRSNGSKDSKGESGDDTTDEEEDEEVDDLQPTTMERAKIERESERYGDDVECRIADTDPIELAKAISRSLWPQHESELKLGLRVDAKDHRGNWFSGSVVEIDDSGATVVAADTDTGEEVTMRGKKVRVHFDNFSSKWDEMYTIAHFEQARVRPLYSHAPLRTKPTEFLIHHRYTDRESGQQIVFGQSFYVECHSEWSNARAGAQILAQASRFLQHKSDWSAELDSNEPAFFDRDGRARRLYDKTHAALSDLIDLLIDCDRDFVLQAIGKQASRGKNEQAQLYRNPDFDATTLSSSLIKKVTALLHRLPFEVKVCVVDNFAPSTTAEESPFPFSLMRTIGNYMHARNAIILQWREPPVDKKSSPQNYLNAPVMYVEPRLVVDEQSSEILKNNVLIKPDNGKNATPGSGGIDLGVCLTEFCKVQKLSINDNWRCPRCKEYREGQQNMNLWRLPDLLTFHIKRFNMSARWREKISTKVNFPLTGLDMSEWCHKESPVIQEDPSDSYVYDLIGVINHYGSLTGGHYVATCKATACHRDGREEVAYGFNGVGASTVETEETGAPSGWRPLRPKAEANQNKVAAAMSARAVSESAEPLWLQFDDELVEPIPPNCVTSEMAYVLFYRRRRITPANIAKYSTLE